jgi:hypothetical protein
MVTFASSRGLLMCVVIIGLISFSNAIYGGDNVEEIAYKTNVLGPQLFDDLDLDDDNRLDFEEFKVYVSIYSDVGKDFRKIASLAGHGYDSSVITREDVIAFMDKCNGGSDEEFCGKVSIIRNSECSNYLSDSECNNKIVNQLLIDLGSNGDNKVTKSEYLNKLTLELMNVISSNDEYVTYEELEDYNLSVEEYGVSSNYRRRLGGCNWWDCFWNTCCNTGCGSSCRYESSCC